MIECEYLSGVVNRRGAGSSGDEGPERRGYIRGDYCGQRVRVTRA
jgi:hypothetical protein